MRRRYLPLLLVPLALAACNQSNPALPGTLEWDRVSILAAVSEPVVAVEVKEGDQVKAGQLLLRLDPGRLDAQLAAAQANARGVAAQLAELQHGARKETIDTARAELARVQSVADHARAVHKRILALRRKGARSQAQLDDAANALHMAEADAEAAHAKLAALLHGARPEDLAQAKAALAAAQAKVDQLTISRNRLDVRATRAGRVDALPFRLGDQPPPGAVLVSLLAGEAPYCRVYVPERMRASMQPGHPFRVRVDGVAGTFDATLRSIRSEPAFTPYYALSGDDVTRLSWRAELVLKGRGAARLPAGVPCHAEPVNQ